jgi:hypothetical protein
MSPIPGYTRRLIHVLVHTQHVSLRRNSVLRVDKEKLDNDIPEPKPEDAQGVLIDEKLLGFSQGFTAVCLNTTTGALLEKERSKDSYCLDLFFRFDEKKKCKIIRLGIDLTNAYKTSRSFYLPIRNSAHPISALPLTLTALFCNLKGFANFVSCNEHCCLNQKFFL